MTYNPPPFNVAHGLIEEIMTFLEECGGPYIGIREQIDATKYHGIILSVLHGQFIYKRGWYFASWFRLTEETLAEVKQFIMPQDVASGDILYIAEFGVRQGMRELTRKIKYRNESWCKTWCKHRNAAWKQFRRTR